MDSQECASERTSVFTEASQARQKQRRGQNMRVVKLLLHQSKDRLNVTKKQEFMFSQITIYDFFFRESCFFFFFKYTAQLWTQK